MMTISFGYRIAINSFESTLIE